MALRICASRVCIPLMIFKETIDEDLIYVSYLTVCDMSLELKEELLKLIVVLKMWETEEHIVGVLAVEEGYQS